VSAVVTGYASLDYTVTLDRAPEPDRTATVLSRASEFLASADRRPTLRQPWSPQARVTQRL
jgi:hypothetical protein